MEFLWYISGVEYIHFTGGNIVNVVYYACIEAVEALYEKKEPVTEQATDENWEQMPEDEGQLSIHLSDVIDGIKRELIKEGEPFTL